MAYVATGSVANGVDDILAVQYNSLMAEVKAACEGISLKDVDIVIAYTGGADNDLPETITITDNSPVGDAGFDITCVGTIIYDGDDLPTSCTWVFAAGELNKTVTETYNYTSGVITSIGKVVS